MANKGAKKLKLTATARGLCAEETVDGLAFSILCRLQWICRLVKQHGVRVVLAELRL